MTRTHNAAVLPDGHGALNSSKNLPPWTTLNSSICGASQLADEQSQPRPTWRHARHEMDHACGGAAVEPVRFFSPPAEREAGGSPEDVGLTERCKF
jgi:hypothetical protein